MKKDERIVINMIKTPDGTILESQYRHDYKVYTDKNGIEYMVDGGKDYLRRRIVEEAPFEEMSLYGDSDIKDIREFFVWGTRGKKGNEPIKYIKLKDMETDHLLAIVETQSQLEGRVELEVFKSEILFREYL